MAKATEQAALKVENSSTPVTVDAKPRGDLGPSEEVSAAGAEGPAPGGEGDSLPHSPLPPGQLAPSIVAGPGPTVVIEGNCHTERIDQLATALAEAQGEIELASKNATNPHLKNTYADLASIREACRGPLSRAGLAITQLPVTKDGRVGVMTRLMHRSGQWLQSELYLPAVKADCQGIGSSITYARRYAMSALLGIAAEEDDDGNEAVKQTANGKKADEKHPAAARAQAKMATAGQVKGDEPSPQQVAKLKGEVWDLVRTVCGVQNEDGSWDDPATMAQARSFLLSANDETYPGGRVPVKDDLADLPSASYKQLQALRSWLQAEALAATKTEGSTPF